MLTYACIHIFLQLPNPDPVDGRPQHGGRDRHTAFTVANIDPLIAALEAAEISYTMSKSGRRAVCDAAIIYPSHSRAQLHKIFFPLLQVFCRDPDANALEFMEIQ